MTFQKYVGKKTIFLIFTVIAFFYVVYRSNGNIIDPPFPFQLVMPILFFVWIIIILNFGIRYAIKSKRSRRLEE